MAASGEKWNEKNIGQIQSKTVEKLSLQRTYVSNDIILIYKSYIKRTFDLLSSGILLLVLSPFFLVISTIIKLETPGPVFFMQKRVGKNLNEFNVFKFRTMTHEKRKVSKIIGKADGVTKIGYYLRRYKIDELPQIINVLKGDMSLVGPRPSIKEQLENMTDEEKERYSIRPGMTGLAQVSGNIHISWKKRYTYDLKYVNNITFLNDIKIILRTVMIIVKGEEKFINHPLSIRETVNE